MAALFRLRPVEMPVETILGNVQFPADEPFGERRFPFEHFFPALLPDQLVCFAGPEFLRTVDRLAIHAPVLLKASNPGALCERLRRFENAFLNKVRLDVFGHWQARG